MADDTSLSKKSSTRAFPNSEKTREMETHTEQSNEQIDVRHGYNILGSLTALGKIPPKTVNKRCYYQSFF